MVSSAGLMAKPDESLPKRSEAPLMTQRVTIAIRLIPWQDRAFVRTFDRVRELVVAEGLTINGPKAAARAEELLRAAGFPRARVEVTRSVDEALAHAAHWTVWRDEPPAEGG